MKYWDAMSETESDGYITDEDVVLFGAALDQVQRTREEES